MVMNNWKSTVCLSPISNQENYITVETLMKLILTFILFLGYNLYSSDLIDSYKYENKRDYSNALASMEKVIKDYPNDYYYWLRSGWLAYIKGQYTKSNSYYQKASLLEKNSIEPRLGQIKALLALGQYKQSDVIAKTVLKLDSKNYYARSSIAFGNYSSGNFKEAIKFYQSILSDYPSDFEMQIGLGWAYLKDNNKKMSKQVFEKLILHGSIDERASSGLYYSNN